MIARYFAVSVVSIGLVAGVQVYRTATAPPTPNVTEVQLDLNNATEEQCQKWQQMNEAEARRARFARYSQAISAQLESQQIDLREAIERMFNSAMHGYPEYLDHVSWSEQGPSIKTKVGRNLLRGLQVVQEQLDVDTDDHSALIAQLECELHRMIGEEVGAGVPIQ